MNVSSNMNSSYHIYCIVFVGIPHINPQARIFIIMQSQNLTRGIAEVKILLLIKTSAIIINKYHACTNAINYLDVHNANLQAT